MNKGKDKAMKTYEQMIEALADWREVDLKWNETTDISEGYKHAIADMFGKDPDEVADDMVKVLKARG